MSGKTVRARMGTAGLLAAVLLLPLRAQQPGAAVPRPRLVVLLVVDQMRADYVDRFGGQWTGGLRRLVQQGAWFREAAYPYAATETCVGHATISTGAFPALHGLISNEWWDRELDNGAGKPKGGRVTCTTENRTEGAVLNVGYAGLAAEGHDGPSRLEIPALADELRFQNGSGTRIVTLSLKARASIMLAGHQADSVTWFDDQQGAWTTSTSYPRAEFVERYATAHPVAEEYGKSWTELLPDSSYLYPEGAPGSVAPEGYNPRFPHPLRGQPGSSRPDKSYFRQWATSPFADSALTSLALEAVEKLELGRHAGTDFLGISYSSVDYVGHSFGPRSREIQDILARLDLDLSRLFLALDRKVGKGRYVVALSADHGVVPIPEELQKEGLGGGVLHLPELQARLEALLGGSYPPRPVSQIMGSDLYFLPEVAQRLKSDPATREAIRNAVLSQPGVAEVYWGEELRDRPASGSPLRRAYSLSYFPGRSGDLLIVPKPYWLMDGTPSGQNRRYGTGHGTPFNYDQHVPLLLMGFGIRPGEYFQNATPADIAPTLAALAGVTLLSRDGRVLSEALSARPAPAVQSRPAP